MCPTNSDEWRAPTRGLLWSPLAFRAFHCHPYHPYHPCLLCHSVPYSALWLEPNTDSLSVDFSQSHWHYISVYIKQFLANSEPTSEPLEMVGTRTHSSLILHSSLALRHYRKSGIQESGGVWDQIRPMSGDAFASNCLRLCPTVRQFSDLSRQIKTTSNDIFSNFPIVLEKLHKYWTRISPKSQRTGHFWTQHSNSVLLTSDRIIGLKGIVFGFASHSLSQSVR